MSQLLEPGYEATRPSCFPNAHLDHVSSIVVHYYLIAILMNLAKRIEHETSFTCTIARNNTKSYLTIAIAHVQGR